MTQLEWKLCGVKRTQKGKRKEKETKNGGLAEEWNSCV